MRTLTILPKNFFRQRNFQKNGKKLFKTYNYFPENFIGSAAARKPFQVLLFYLEARTFLPPVCIYSQFFSFHFAKHAKKPLLYLTPPMRQNLSESSYHFPKLRKNPHFPEQSVCIR